MRLPFGGSHLAAVIPVGLLVPLLQRARAGDEAALEDLLVRLHPILLRFLQRRLEDAPGGSVAEDAAADALMRIVDGLGTCNARTEGQIISWALSVARNAGIDILRREIAQAAAAAAADPAMHWTAPSRSQAPRTPEEEALLCLVEEVYRSLPVDLQMLLWLRLIDGAPWAEVAREIGTTAGGAKRKFQRVQARLRRSVTERIHALDGRVRDVVLRRLAAIGVRIER